MVGGLSSHTASQSSSPVPFATGRNSLFPVARPPPTSPCLPFHMPFHMCDRPQFPAPGGGRTLPSRHANDGGGRGSGSSLTVRFRCLPHNSRSGIRATAATWRERSNSSGFIGAPPGSALSSTCPASEHYCARGIRFCGGRSCRRLALTQGAAPTLKADAWLGSRQPPGAAGWGHTPYGPFLFPSQNKGQPDRLRCSSSWDWILPGLANPSRHVRTGLPRLQRPTEPRRSRGRRLSFFFISWEEDGWDQLPQSRRQRRRRRWRWDDGPRGCAGSRIQGERQRERAIPAVRRRD